MIFVSGATLTGKLRELLKGDRVEMAVAYWGKDACKMLGLAEAMASSRVACDAFSGACNPSAIEDLLRRGIEVRDVPRLHAKVFIAGCQALIGSANASANGLGSEDQELATGLEAGVFSQDVSVVEEARRWFDEIYAIGTLIEKKDIPRIRSIWSQHRAKRTSMYGGRLIDAIRQREAALKDRRFFVTLNPPAEYDCENLRKLKEKHYTKNDGSAADHFWGSHVKEWNFLPQDIILSFEQHDNKTIKFAGLWRVDALLEQGALVPLTRIKNAFGLSISVDDGRKMASRIKSLVDLGLIEVDVDPITMNRLLAVY